MASTYSSDLRIELIANGEQSGTWGSTTNNNLGTLIESAISGRAVVTVTSDKQALTAIDGAADQARCAAIEVVNGYGANCAIYAPPVTKLYVVENTSLLYNLTVYANTGPLPPNSVTAAGDGVVVPPGKTVLIRCNTVDMIDCVSHLGSLTLNTALPTPSGGTGFSSYNIGDLLYASSNVALAKLASTNTGNVLITNGVNTAPSWGKANLTTAVTGTLPVTNGGTGLATAPSANAVLIGNGTAFTLSNLTAGANITITNAGGALTIASSGGGGSGGGNVTGSGVTVDNAIVRWNGTAGTSIQNSSATLSDTGTLVATAFSGSGVALSALNASNITSGTIPAARLPSANTTAAGAVSTGAQEFAGAKRFAKGSSVNADSPSSNWPLYVFSSSGDPALNTYNNSSAGYAIQAAYYNGRSNPIVFTEGTTASGATEVGSITGTASAISYNTSSDYRLKENVAPLTDAVTKLKLLAPKRFTWKNAPEDGVAEGFIAHEVQAIIPQAVHGEKDGLYPDGRIKPQSMDASFLIPLLTAALQEAVTRIEALESQLGT
jgi:hypothetical protein